MPDSLGRETITEALLRLRTELARVRRTIARSEDNGTEFRQGGTAVTQLDFDRAVAREKKLMAEIAGLEARRAGTRVTPGVAHTQTRIC